MPVFVNGWNKAGTEAGTERQTEDGEEERHERGNTRRTFGHLEAAHAVKQDIIRKVKNRGKVGGCEISNKEGEYWLKLNSDQVIGTK